MGNSNLWLTRCHGQQIIAQIRARAAAELARLPEKLRRLESGHDYPVTIAHALTALAAQADAKARGKA